MVNTTQNEKKIDFCVRYLVENGVGTGDFQRLAEALPLKKIVPFELVERANDYEFFSQIAQGLRELWPSGLKDGKWPWKESVNTLVQRLKFVWERFELSDKYTVEDCLAAARKYLAQFEHYDVKYMLLLKYFIFKQKNIGTSKNGIYKKDYESPLVKFLESVRDDEEMIEAGGGGEFI